jgi:hypothetical protein
MSNISAQKNARTLKEIFFIEIFTNKKQELPMTAMFVNGSKRNEHFP